MCSSDLFPSHDSSILNNDNIYEEVCRVTYYAMVRGMKVLSIDDPSMYGATPELQRAALVTMLCIRDRIVYDEPLLYTYYFRHNVIELAKEIEGKKASDYGLIPKYAILHGKSEIRLEELPDVVYISEMGIEYESEKEAFSKFMLGAISLTGYGSFIRYFPKQNKKVDLGEE